MDEAKQKIGWKQKLRREFVRYWINVVDSAFFFGLFAWYRRLVLAEYQIQYLKYGVAIVEALVLAKVVLIGDALGMGKKLFKYKPLIYPTLYNAFAFTLLVAAFALLECMVRAVLEGKGPFEGLAELRQRGGYELLGRCLVSFCAFIPFFAFKELAKTMGEGKLGKLFFRSGGEVTA